MESNSFINMKLRASNLDIFHIRSSIFKAVKEFCKKADGELLDIGCGQMPYKDFILNNSSIYRYIGLDIENALQYDEEIRPDIRWDGRNMPIENETFDYAMGTEVLEHCPQPEIVLKETFRILKHGGGFFFTVPFLWNLHEIPNDEFRYTPFSLERLLKEAGFIDITIKPHGGWHASLAQMLGLWIKRAPMNPRARKTLRLIFTPAIKILLDRDKRIHWTFDKPIMITGLSGMAFKPK